MIDNVIIRMAEKCDLQCQYCLEDKNHGGSYLSYDEISKIVDIIKLYNPNCNLILTGAEYLPHEEFSKMMSKITDSGLPVLINLNAICITQQMIDELKKHNIKKLYISLEGLYSINGMTRTQEMAALILKNIKLLKREFEIEITCMMNKVNLSFLEDLANYFSARDITVMFSFLSCQTRTAKLDFFFDDIMTETFLYLERLKKKYKIQISMCDLPQECPILAMEKLIPYIDSKGNVFSCVALREEKLKISNVNDCNFSEYVFQALLLKSFQNLMHIRGAIMQTQNCVQCFFVNPNNKGRYLADDTLKKKGKLEQSIRCYVYDKYGRCNYIKDSI